MKLLSILLSIALCAYLALDFVQHAGSQAQINSNLQKITAKAPARVSEKLLVSEEIWQAAKTKRLEEQKKPTAIKVKPRNQQVLTIGDQEYILYGIFNDPSSPFILLKDEAGQMLKLTKGDKLAEDATLVSLHSNKITFDKNNQAVEFKLFERKNNAPN